MNKKKIILRNSFSPGDVVLLTAAVRDLHLCYPGRFVTDVRTPYPELWEHNPYLGRLDENADDVEVIECDYPLINHCNETPYHAIHGFMDFLNQRLGLNIKPTAFKGDIHLSAEEKKWASQVHELTGEDTPFWIIVAGGKPDITIKWWDAQRYQAIVDHFKEKILFVQVGAANHDHPRLKGVFDFRGKTDLRQLLRLVYHAQGVLCPVTLLMHLAAAVEVKGGVPKNRPCVVVAGGREPAHWEAYPHHQFIHTNGSLLCCDNGGCWKSRTVPLQDGDERDRPENLCVNVVGQLPKCMDMITADEVINRIEGYFDGGAAQYLNSASARTVRVATILGNKTKWNSDKLENHSFAQALDHYIKLIPPYPEKYKGRGIVICGGGQTYFTCAWVCVKMLRHLGCNLPVQLWHLGPAEVNPLMKAIIAPLNVECVDALELRKLFPARLLDGWPLKPYSILHSPFREVLLLDADNVPVVNPEYLFDTNQFRETGATFWPDIGRLKEDRSIWNVCGVIYRDEPEFESGQVLVDKKECWRALCLTMWLNENSDFYYLHMHGDKETFHMAFRRLQQPYAMPDTPVQALEGTLCQHDFMGRRIFQHRNSQKWNLDGNFKRVWGFYYEMECITFIKELRKLWKGDEGVPRFIEEERSDRLKAVAQILTSQLYQYDASGARRTIEFAPDGLIRSGGGNCERFWDLRNDAHGTALLISSEKCIICRFRFQRDGSWRGHWVRDEKVSVVIFPLVKFNDMPTKQNRVRKLVRRTRRSNEPILIRAPLNGYTGYGLHACQIVTDFQKMGYKTKIRAFHINETFASIPPNVRHDVVSEEQPDEWELVLSPPGYKAPVGKKTIYFTMWESTRPPGTTPQLFNRTECVIVPSYWNASCFSASGVEKPIRVVPLGINTGVFSFAPMETNGPCVFGTAGRLEAGGIRKGISQVMSAFQKAFPREKDVRLKIKVFPDCEIARAGDKRIEIIRAWLSEAELAQWYRCLTCFVSTAKGEGWGLMQHQALAVGRPIISIRYGGVAEFFGEDMGYALDFKIVPASGFYTGCGAWAEPNEEHLIELMREVYKNRGRACKFGKNGANYVKRFTWQASNRALVRIMQEFGMLT